MVKQFPLPGHITSTSLPGSTSLSRNNGSSLLTSMQPPGPSTIYTELLPLLTGGLASLNGIQCVKPTVQIVFILILIRFAYFLILEGSQLKQRKYLQG